jgi:hypothetical protein
MKRSIIIASTILLFVAACKSSKSVTTPLSETEADVARMSSKFEGYTLAQLKDGKMHYQQKCASCHGLKNPTSRNEAQWQSIVPEMTAKANRKAGKVVIDNKSQDLILKYLITMSTAPKKVN